MSNDVFCALELNRGDDMLSMVASAAACSISADYVDMTLSPTFSWLSVELLIASSKTWRHR